MDIKKDQKRRKPDEKKLWIDSMKGRGKAKRLGGGGS